MGRKDDYQTLKDALLNLYSKTRPISKESINAINIFMVARAFDMIEWVSYYWPDFQQHPPIHAILNNTLNRIEFYSASTNPGEPQK